ncbi:DNA mismatch repair protein MSH2, putative [Plasmodium knowlesi strain H]|uniref:DNA mismatch repair protein MSH2, putative n=3 Tax=Plasmodium knowlesi TaxID=5850 RepID=A0A5K1TZK0_PLAKH|nr:DNA mismatch repair protein, Msh2p-like protein [Plasmodium knowlesi strain H]OTN67766.1 putative DNA mismatch repair protein MSH2 [Plasmodium knowlesi]CAA9990348.1 DNA mismatch repair protein MSH2, putative [Plasmodium knowlesi strain H]SBO19554.1 DNA mismatch repair protein MSH2, putative [Plasmodium knowlesi strain H]SBO22726.1 DNA mismatch repair protein MSH2, putative [Plasmodium knowlesi strain H]VVS79822.1 DNA mismatch repair protein MSH2, putative [Plasmodium knowlesi strain H]|eukprot:XP_002260749.1 DNA mismatch repair protein, Msh2p-like protein [Plasmodium knowlesi strain H]
MENHEGVELNDEQILCLYIDTKKYQKTVGVCFYNYLKYEFLMTEFIDNGYFTALESLLIQKRPYKCFFNSMNDVVDDERLLNLFKMCNIEASTLERKKYDVSNLQEELKLIIPQNDDVRNYDKHLELQNACRCLMVLINHLKVKENKDIHNQCRINIHNMDLYMRLDKAAISALNILPNKKNTNSYSNNTSLLKFLNKCNTTIGYKKLVSWLTQPLTSVAEINKRLNIVETFIEDDDLRNNVYCNYLKRIPELDKLNHYLKEINQNNELKGNSKYNEEMILKDIVKLYYAILDFKEIYFSLVSIQGKHKQTIIEMVVNPLHEVLNNFSKLLDMIEMTIDLKEIEENKVYLISKNFDEELEQISNEKNALMKKIKRHKEEVEEDLFSDVCDRRYKRTNREDIRLVDCNTNVFLFRVSKKDFSLIQHQKKCISVRMNKNELLFTTKTLKGLCKEYEHCLNIYNTLQLEIVKKTICAVSTYTPVIEKFIDIVSTLDVLVSFAVVCYNSPFPYVRPTVVEGGENVIMKKSRHPLLELQHNLSNFIPNDIHMNKKESRLIIVTGPNMGGKSTYIRQTAIICILAQIGMFVPCDVCEVPVFSQVMCRVGASDFQLKGISTFLSEMIEASAIVKNADQNSFIIVDELGRGTSTYEGLGISWSIGKYILDHIKCFCLFATHFHEISNIAYQCEGVINRHVETTIDQKQKKICFLYEIKDGASNKSYGVNVAEIAKLPKDVIEKAYEKVEELESAENKYYLKEKLNIDTSSSINENYKNKISNYMKIKEEINYLFSSSSESEFMDRFMSKKNYLKELAI